jgi:hypothetical protein
MAGPVLLALDDVLGIQRPL